MGLEKDQGQFLKAAYFMQTSMSLSQKQLQKHSEREDEPRPGQNRELGELCPWHLQVPFLSPFLPTRGLRYFVHERVIPALPHYQL